MESWAMVMAISRCNQDSECAGRLRGITGAIASRRKSHCHYAARVAIGAVPLENGPQFVPVGTARGQEDKPVDVSMSAAVMNPPAEAGKHEIPLVIVNPLFSPFKNRTGSAQVDIIVSGSDQPAAKKTIQLDVPLSSYCQ
ncbi:MAG: hypothetical protein M2R45_00581 [Verrucomicrobia subdivision 3 bacterium]|nr:hypothetical protein [Limisphaerales bacterium]MCS1413542.1 hypothetical protein [Limisphaerales bacterium]